MTVEALRPLPPQDQNNPSPSATTDAAASERTFNAGGFPPKRRADELHT